MSIYTRTGDKGKTSLIGGKRVLKSSPRVESYGAVDELNSVLGVVVTQLSAKHMSLKQELEHVQHDLFSIGAYLADPGAQRISFLGDRVEEFELMIDSQTKKLPPLRNFILPGGGKSGSLLHEARTVCRRAERQIVSILEKEDVDDGVVRYMNRLSDLLFSSARYVNHMEKKKETIWKHT
jgi:cob(I)alamin adenosyltransferase